MKRTIVNEIHVDQSVSTVWQALTRSDRLSQWLMDNDFKPTKGHKFKFVSDPAAGSDGIVNCEVLEVTPNSRLVYRWCGGPLMNTELTWELHPEGGGTHIRATQSGFDVFKWIFTALVGGRWKKLDRRYLFVLKEHLNGG